MQHFSAPWANVSVSAQFILVKNQDFQVFLCYIYFIIEDGSKHSTKHVISNEGVNESRIGTHAIEKSIYYYYYYYCYYYLMSYIEYITVVFFHLYISNFLESPTISREVNLTPSTKLQR